MRSILGLCWFRGCKGLQPSRSGTTIGALIKTWRAPGPSAPWVTTSIPHQFCTPTSSASAPPAQNWCGTRGVSNAENRPTGHGQGAHPELFGIRARTPVSHCGAGVPARALEFGHFRRGTNAKPELDAWIAAQRLNRLAQAAVAEAMAPLMLW